MHELLLLLCKEHKTEDVHL